MVAPWVAAARRGPALVVLAAVCWGTGGLAGSVLGTVSGLSPIAVGAYRLLVAAVVLVAVHAVRGQLTDLVLAARDLGRHGPNAWRVLGVGAGLAVFQVCYFLAVREMGVSVATMLTLGLAPVLVTVGGAVALRERVDARVRLVLPVALVGLVLLVGGAAGVQPDGDGRAWVGAMFAVVSASGYASVTLLGGSLSRRVAAEHVTTFGFVTAAVVALPVGLAVGMTAPLSGTTLALVVYLGVVPTAAAYAMFFAGLRGTPSGTVAVITLLEPLTATLLAVILVDERLGLWQWLGAALLVAALLALAVGRRPVTAPRGDLPSGDERQDTAAG